jgi:hypothetical protein
MYLFLKTFFNHEILKKSKISFELKYSFGLNKCFISNVSSVFLFSICLSNFLTAINIGKTDLVSGYSFMISKNLFSIFSSHRSEFKIFN